MTEKHFIPGGGKYVSEKRVKELLAESRSLRKELSDEAVGHLKTQHRGAEENIRLRAEVERLQNALEVCKRTGLVDQEFEDKYAGEFKYGRSDRNDAVLAKFERPSGEYAGIHKSDMYRKIKEAVQALCGVVNSGDPETMAEAFYAAFVNEHRTLQAQMVAALIGFFDLYKDGEWDLRNRAAVRAAEIITRAAKRDGVYIPLI